MEEHSTTPRDHSGRTVRGSNSQETSNESSANASRSGSVGADPQRSRGFHHVKFFVGGDESDDTLPNKPLPNPRLSLKDLSSPNPYFPDSIDKRSADVTETPKDQLSPAGSPDEEEEDNVVYKEKVFSALSAQDRAQRLASLLGSHSAPGSRRNSSELDTVSRGPSPAVSRTTTRSRKNYPVRIDDIPLVEINGSRRPYSLYEESTDDDEDSPEKVHRKATDDLEAQTGKRRHRAESNAEANNIIQSLRGSLTLERVHGPPDGLKSGQITPIEERDPDAYAPHPREYKTGILSSLLKLYDQQGASAAVNGPARFATPRNSRAFHNPRKDQGDEGTPITGSSTPGSSPRSSGRNTPQRAAKWYNHKSPNQSTSSLAGLLNASTMMAAPGSSSNTQRPNRPRLPGRSHSTGLVSSALHRMHKPHLEDEIQITIHIAEVLARQKYLMKLCRALMIYGAPTHRLEEYMRMSARVLQIEGQFLYMPGCMIISFDDTTTHTTEVKLVKAAQGVDLGKLKDTHTIYKEVVHDMIGVEEATQSLDIIMKAAPKYGKWVLVPVYGFASAFVGPFAFGARPIDMPMSFLLGSLLGFLQLVAAPASDLYSNVFEISAAVLTSFLARALGSIYSPTSGEPYFCFSAMAQSSIALILPGYIILCGSLELQSRNLVAGSVRMVYAIIYALFLGFGITIGTAVWGLIDPNAISSVTCPTSKSMEWWDHNTYLSHFPFVPLFTLCLIIINQAKWSQAPVMVFIAFAGYQVNFWSERRFANNVQVANALGAFAIGVLGNLYSRIGHGLAAAALLPAIFVQVPSGLAASGSLVSGITSANQITGNATGVSVISNGTQGFLDSSNSSGTYSDTVFNLGYGMVQVAIGISVGLFLSSLVVYPFGKRRSGLFSF